MSRPSAQDVTQLLEAWRGGDNGALDKLIPLVYQELRRVAHRYMNREHPGHMLQTTALVNEAYLRLVDARRVQWEGRAHFLAIAAKLMRRILVEYARSRQSLKRGGKTQQVSVQEVEEVVPVNDRDILNLHEALKTFSGVDPRSSRVVELRIFGGLTVDETAEVLEVSRATVSREWRLAKAWLLRELSKGNGEEA